jgi:hypothetical protein
VIAPPITKFRTGTEKALDPPPGRAFSFWSSFSNAIRDGAGESSVPSPFRTALDDFLRHCRVEATERCECTLPPTMDC